MSAPIPRRLLIHAGLLEAFDKTVNSAPTFKPPVTLTNVRFDPVKQNAMTSLGDMKADRFVMFLDCVNSTPQGTVPAVKDRITFGANVLTVRKVTPCYASSPNVHHYEVSCV